MALGFVEIIVDAYDLTSPVLVYAGPDGGSNLNDSNIVGTLAIANPISSLNYVAAGSVEVTAGTETLEVYVRGGDLFIMRMSQPWMEKNVVNLQE